MALSLKAHGVCQGPDDEPAQVCVGRDLLEEDPEGGLVGAEDVPEVIIVSKFLVEDRDDGILKYFYEVLVRKSVQLE